MPHHAVRIHHHGGPEVLSYEAIDVPDPGPGDVRLAHTAVGLNYIDVYHRSGLYGVPEFPCTLGMEGAGTVATVGPDVTVVTPGDRVAYASPPVGAYADARTMPADRAVPLPSSISDRQAAAMMLQGMTVSYLIRSVVPIEPGMTVLFHAAAGGVGLIACQWLRALGATVIGTVGSRAKADLVRAHGCHHPIIYTEESFPERVQEITGGAGVPVVYDSVGAATWDGSLDCLQRRGTLVSFGNASGAVPQFDPGELARRGSLFLTRPTLMDYTITRAELLDHANALFDVVQRGDVVVEINQTYDLADAAAAHKDLEARTTTGSTILLP